MERAKAYAIVNEYGNITSELGTHFHIYRDFETATRLRKRMMEVQEREYFVVCVSIEKKQR